MMSRPGRRGCCRIIHLKEDNARFLLLAIVMVFYMLSGAALFTALERDNEVEEKRIYDEIVKNFKEKYTMVNESDLQYLLDKHSEAETAGIVGNRRPRWDFSGAFYFVGTVVSTIGFGMTTPRTPAGKVVLIFYGFFGCAGAILFFNLFLERIITFLAYILRAIHERGQRKKGLMGRRRSSQGSEDEQLDSWKPSVYWVMLILLLGATVVAVIASGMYHPVEDWTYWEAMYFCFVAFSTIGFGDYVVSQQAEYPNVVLYRLGNFIFIVLGCCCIYSLFNVTSIVIKQMLNWMLRKLNCECRIRKPPMTRRNAITPGHLQRGGTMSTAGAAPAGSATGGGATKAPTVTVTDADGDSDSEYRRNSGEMISMKDFLQANKISLAMMQKQLWETSQRGSSFHNNNSGFQGGVGPLAILNRKLGQDEYDPNM
ncbi:tandem pore domain potassium channel [Aplysia californica]|uniref:Tandem pore domain potassium channel n=1 Tax=Aplysia californica TaxID=6500 RepID=Q8I6M6_APLCA|nr:tandem pore domain potassium channel [Aplysia californica]AAN62847.1 tandem pore domain potassium channel [Aplysia californica]